MRFQLLFFVETRVRRRGLGATLKLPRADRTALGAALHDRLIIINCHSLLSRLLLIVPSLTCCQSLFSFCKFWHACLCRAHAISHWPCLAQTDVSHQGA